jgi:hypothetical protein
MVLLFILWVFTDNTLNKIPFGIKLPFGWNDCWTYESWGFPFSVYSEPPPLSLCAKGFNPFAYFLNFALLVVVAYIIYKFIRKIIKKQPKPRTNRF